MSEKPNKLISRCPVCSEQLYVSHMKCLSCDTEVSGTFVANEFARLPEDKLEFLRTFIACRGNLKEIEAVLDISYPTIRSRLNELLAALELDAGQRPEPPRLPVDRSEVLAALERGEITVAEAERKLRR
jgi:hypothetical protein